jgi:hypothetical protein
MRTKAKVVIQPEKPSSGPEFPGSPEQDKTIDAIVWFQIDGSDKGDTVTLDKRYSLSTKGGVSHSESVDEPGIHVDQWVNDTIHKGHTNCGFYGYGYKTQHFRIFKGMIVVKTEVTECDGAVVQYPYAYCYQKGAKQ